MRYSVHKCENPPSMNPLPWNFDGEWKTADAGRIISFHNAGSDHKPTVEFRALYNENFIFVRFDIKDCFVKSIRTEPQSHVCADSCVEFFVEPPGKHGYFNFEVNAGGTPHASRIEIPIRTPDGFEKWELIRAEWMDKLNIAHNLPSSVNPEISANTDWTVMYSIPLDLFAEYGVRKSHPETGDVWRANFYKCGDDTSHPHWGFWNDIGEKLDFHQPDKFGDLTFC